MPVKIFFCYAREDEILLNKLKKHLIPLQREGLIELWYDRDISAGTEWEREININLNAAQIVLLLVSPDFIASDYCYSKEMKRALERNERREAKVIPIVLRPVYWQGVLGKLQALPTDAKPITSQSWHDLDEAFFNVAEGIRKVVRTLLVQASSAPVPFSEIIPPQEQRWVGSTHLGINIPIGRTEDSKLQSLKLGQSINQSAVVVSRASSAKTDLLHTLILNLALFYSPKELELYFADFKAVQDTLYVARQLPHTRVIAIGSERKFGLEVLNRLYLQLESRKDSFARKGVMTIEQYRNAFPDQHMPRILLFMDDLQRLFIQEDQIAQDASLLLNSLIWQGRAFGINILLWTQKLVGIYVLDQATIDMIAVRIVLQCEEADAHLALSSDNHGARLLSNPYEAIYNDDFGSVEGNKTFQIASPKNSLYDFLQLIGELKAKHKVDSPAPIIFDSRQR